MFLEFSMDFANLYLILFLRFVSYKYSLRKCSQFVCLQL
uniref:Uncharacterized protein n=1 Tax=Heterorhabditis bacteriophora TaxID=37862 RepID=A0A1I7XN93_HETBA